MRPIVDIIGDVIEAMKPEITGDITEIGGSGTYIISEETAGDWLGEIQKLYVGQKVIMTTAGDEVYMGYIDEINDQYPAAISNIQVELYENQTGITDFVSCQPIINYHYGHPLEVVNELSERLIDNDNKTLQFPVIFLPMDIEEERNVQGYDAIAELSFVLMIDTKPEYKAADRYTYSFDTILYNLYDNFISKLAASTEMDFEFDGSGLPKHKKYDRLYWGKNGLYGNTANIFNDFVDAIEINKLKVKILKTC